jgi:hypothetical protein
MAGAVAVNNTDLISSAPYKWGRVKFFCFPSLQFKKTEV